MNDTKQNREVRAGAAVAKRSAVIESITADAAPAMCSSTQRMAHLWQLDDTTDGGWMPLPLEPGTRIADASTSFERACTPEGESWLVLGDATARVNGDPLDVGIAVLRERDEILAAGQRVFFSTESLATVTTCARGERPVYCPRCKLEIAAETSVVRCPACGVLHHQSEELPCWTYAEHCTTCDQPTALDAGFRWTPEAL